MALGNCELDSKLLYRYFNFKHIYNGQCVGYELANRKPNPKEWRSGRCVIMTDGACTAQVDTPWFRFPEAYIDRSTSTPRCLPTTAARVQLHCLEGVSGGVSRSVLTGRGKWTELAKLVKRKTKLTVRLSANTFTLEIMVNNGLYFIKGRLGEPGKTSTHSKAAGLEDKNTLSYGNIVQGWEGYQNELS